MNDNMRSKIITWLSVAEHARVDMHITKIDYRFKTKINKLTSDIASFVFQLTLKYQFIRRNYQSEKTATPQFHRRLMNL